MKLKEVKEYFKNQSLSGGFFPGIEVYMFFYVISFAIEMMNNCINTYVSGDKTLAENKYPDTRAELIVLVIRRVIDNILPWNLVFHYTEFILQVSMAIAYIYGTSGLYTLRFMRRLFSPAYLTSKGVINIVLFYKAMESQFQKAKKTTKSIVQLFIKSRDQVLLIADEQKKDKELVKIIKHDSKEIYEDLKETVFEGEVPPIPDSVHIPPIPVKVMGKKRKSKEIK